MSFLTISKSVRDQELRYRVQACVLKQAWYNPTLAVTDFGKILKTAPERAADIIWLVCGAPDIETAYAFALENNVPNPGGNEAIVTDAMISAVIIARWPMGTMT